MLIRLPLVEAELRAVHLPDLTSAPPHQSARELFASTPAQSKFVFARFQHELDHLVRLLSTGVGLFVHQLDSQFLDQFRWVAEQSPGHRFAEPKPLVTDHDLSDGELFSTATERHAAVRLWFRTDSLRRALYDVPLESEFVQALTLLSQFREGQTEVEVAAAWPPTPACGPGHTLTGRNILEFFAVLSEIDYTGLLVDDNHAWRALFEDSDYSAVTLFWQRAFPSASLWDVDPGQRLARDFRLMVRLAYPLELYACLDLALWPPLLPTGVHPPSGRWTWEDIHPGYRFARLCQWLRATDTRFTRIGGEDRNDRFRAFQETACKDLGWPPVSELAGAWRADTRRRLGGEPRVTSHLLGISLERAGDSRLNMIDRLLRAREESPCDLVLGNLPAVELGVGHMGLVTPQAGGLVIADASDRSSELSPALVRALMMTGRFLLRGSRCGGDHPDYFHSDHVDDALAVLGQLVGPKAAGFEEWARAVLAGES